VVAAVAVGGCGGSKHAEAAPSDGLAQALAYVPLQAPVVIALTTDPDHGQGAAARKLLDRFIGSEVAVAQAKARLTAALGLPADADLRPLMGNDLVAARTRDGSLVVWVVKDEDALRAILRDRTPDPGVRVVARGPLLVAGAPGAVSAALATQARGGGMTRQLFDERLLGLPADSLVRAEANLALLPAVQGSKIAWLHTLRRAALTVRADDAGVHARARVAGAPGPPDDIPLAPGATPPVPLDRSNGATVGIRDLRHTIRAALSTLKATDPGTYRRYDLARRAFKLLRRGDIDRDVIDQLGGTATLWSADLATYTLTAPVADPGRMANALNGLKPIMGRLLAAAGLDGARYGVVGDTLVVTTTSLPLDRLAAGSPRRIGSLTGALTGIVHGATLRQTLIDRLGLPSLASLALAPLGDATFSVQTSATGADVSGDLPIH
jgi:hypothetical protein